MRSKSWSSFSICSALFTLATGCNLGLDEVKLSVRGTPFVLRGTAAVLESNGPCPIWVGENGETYHLFQDPSLENEAFDEVVQPGVTSRLVLVTRSDLTLDCQAGVIVEVRDVLEVEE